MNYIHNAKWLVLSVLALMLCTSDAFSDPGDFSGDGIQTLMKKVNIYTHEHPYRESDCGWIRGTYYTGVLGAYHATGDQEYLAQTRAWGEKHQWKIGTDYPGANKLFPPLVWAELNLLEPDPQLIDPTITFLHTDIPSSPACGEVWYGHSGEHKETIYADALYAAPVFPMLYKATGDHEYIDIMNDFFWSVTDTIFDEEDHLYYRDDHYIGQRTENGKKLLWSRGNGWVFGAIPRILQHLPKDDPSYNRYADLYQKMAASLIACQHEDGFWRSNLGDRDQYLMPESSGTAFFTFGLAWGVNNDILDKETYLPAVIKGWNSLAGSVHPDGNFGWVQPVDAQPRPSLPVTTHEYATGLFLLAGSEMLKLTESGAVTPAIAQQHLADDAIMLPSSALRESGLELTDHPLADKINSFMERQSLFDVSNGSEPFLAEGPINTLQNEFTSTGLDREDYLDVIASQVRVMRTYQDSTGRIIDPVAQQEMYYSTPCYAHCVGVLATAKYGIDDETLESGMKALDVSLSALATGHVPGRHGDFFTWPVMLAYELFKPLASNQRQEMWEQLIASIEPSKAYNAYLAPYKAHEHRQLYDSYGETGGNWHIVNMAGEFLRARQGFTDMEYVDFTLTMHLSSFTPYGMYNERGNPLPYDLFPRHYLSGMLQRGYRSFVYSTYRDLLWKGAWSSLFMQSPTGELPTGYRSSQHIWNEAEEAVLFEIYASEYAKAGKTAEAGAFKRAAHLALSSVNNWIRSDGSGHVVKNRYPMEERHGYESYSAHSCYNMLACSMLAEAWQYADDRIEERPCPADLGGFAFTTPGFHKLFANAGGTYVEYETAGDDTYNPLGLIRIHLKDGHPLLGPSDGCAPKFSGSGVNYAVGPAWQDEEGNWTKLADLTNVIPEIEVLEETPEKVRMSVTYSFSPPLGDATELTELITITPDEVIVEDRITGEGVRQMRIYYPMLVFDGENETDVRLDGQSLRLLLNGQGVCFSILDAPAATLIRSGDQITHRNGLVEPCYFDVMGARAKYRISAE